MQWFAVTNEQLKLHMRDSDFNLISIFLTKVEDKEKKCGSHSLTVEERVVSLIWGASGIIENGGFQYFYEQEFDAEAVATAYEKIGCNKCAELLRLSRSLFPDQIFRAGLSERIQFIEHNSAAFYNLSNAFWEADEEMQKRLADYIKMNRRVRE